MGRSRTKKKDEDVFTKHRRVIAIQTLKMNDQMANVIGGMTKAEAKAFLFSIGFSNKAIREYEKWIIF